VSDGKTYLKIALKDGYIHLLNLQIEGKKRLPIDELLRGFKIGDYALE
jgi:methionyl-tRNA formyltransferase